MSAWRWIGRRWNTTPGRSRSSPRSTWPRILRIPGRGCGCCLAWKAVGHRRAIKRERSSGRRCRIYGLTRQTACRRFPIRSSRLIERCGWASTGSSVRSNSGTPPASKLPLRAGKKSWYSDDPKSSSGRAYFDLATNKLQPVEVPAGIWSVSVAKKSNGVVKKNSGASLVDLGDGVGCIEFHSKMNSLGADIIGLILQTLKPGGPGDSFDAFVITNDATNFSVGANLMLLLMSVQEEEWDDVDLAIRQFQGMTQAIKFSAKPVVS